MRKKICFTFWVTEKVGYKAASLIAMVTNNVDLKQEGERTRGGERERERERERA